MDAKGETEAAAGGIAPLAILRISVCPYLGACRALQAAGLKGNVCLKGSQILEDQVKPSVTPDAFDLEVRVSKRDGEPCRIAAYKRPSA